MKLKHLLLPMLCLTLMGCEETVKGSETPSTSDTGGDLTNTTTPSGNTDSSTTTPDDENPSTENPDQETPNPDTEDPDPTPTPDPNVNNTQWPDAIWKDMKTYLGGEVLPYVELGNVKDLEGEWYGNDSSYSYHATYYKITAMDLEELDDDTLDDFEDIYEAAGWVVDKDEATATYDSKHLTVKLKEYSDYYYDEEYVYLECYYDEPFDSTTISAWPTDIDTEIKSHLHNHDIPFIYLGSTNITTYTSTYSSSTYALKVRADNGTWNDQIITDAKTKLTADTWTCTEETGSYSNKLTATKTLTDGCKITMVVASLETSTAAYKKGEITFSIEEGYDSTGYTLPSDWTNNYKADFDNHDIPAIYLGVSSPTVYYSSYSGYVTFTGNTWYDQILTDAKTTFNNSTDNWEYEDKTVYEHSGLIAHCKFADGCRINIRIGQYSSYNTKPEMYVYYEDKLGTTTLTDWDSDTKTAIATNLGSDITIPYVYLGDDDTTATWSSYSNALTIEAESGTYNSDMALNLETALIADGWTQAKKEWDYKGLTYSATKTLTNGNKYTITIEPPTSSYYGPSIKIAMEETFTIPAAGTTWPTAVITDMKTNLNGYTLPYVYLGTLNPQSSWSTYSSYLTITGGKWDDQVLTLFKTALSGWTIVEDTYSNKSRLTATTSDATTSQTIKAVLYYYSYSGKAVIELSAAELFQEPAAGTTWPTAVSSAMTSNMGGHEVPYIYLATSNPTANTNYVTSYNEVDIEGGAWDDRIVDITVSNLTADGYTASKVTNSTTYYAQGYKIFSDGCTMRVVLGKYSDKAKLYVFYGTSYTASTSTSWSSANQTVIDTYLGGYNLPYIDTGATEMTATYDSSSKYVKFSLSNVSVGERQTIALKALETFKAADNGGWKLELTPSTSFTKFTGELEQADGSVITVAFDGYSTTTMKVTYTSAVKGTAWNDTIKGQMTTLLGEVIPYINVGVADDAMTANVYSSSGYLYITGGVFKDYMFTDMETTYKADTNHTWSMGYDYSSSSNGKTLIASTEVSSGKHITIKLYGYKNSSTNVKEAKLYVYIN